MSVKVTEIGLPSNISLAVTFRFFVISKSSDFVCWEALLACVCEVPRPPACEKSKPPKFAPWPPAIPPIISPNNEPKKSEKPLPPKSKLCAPPWLKLKLKFSNPGGGV